jgi:hypothetical protein
MDLLWSMPPANKSARTERFGALGPLIAIGGVMWCSSHDSGAAARQAI